MAIFDEHRMRRLRRLWHSGEAPALLVALIFCVVTAYLMVSAELLPAEDGYGIAGILFIYATVFVLTGGIIKMLLRPAIRLWAKSRGGSGDAA
ncbi:MAG: hypothetical protein OXP75_09935 [Rhodospirillales bacterium]|nr:hypothetical protein [Rhodospirillales bacterium]